MECTIDNVFNLRDLVLQELVKIITLIIIISIKELVKIIILTNSCNTGPSKLKALSILRPTRSKINLEMALQLGLNM